MAYKFGKFVWFECITSDVEAAKAFYTETLGWKSTEMEMGDFKYTMLGKSDPPACGVVEPQIKGVPNHWASYVSVEDVDAAAEVATKAGGTVVVPGTDIPNIGRFSLVKDPQGAMLNLFKGVQSDDNASTGFHWNELYADDIGAVAPFYEKVLGYTTETMDMPDGNKYTLFKKGDTSVAGGMTKPMKEIPSMWLPYVAVDDVDETVARVKRHGGEVKMGPLDAEGIGRFATIVDNKGAALGLITPSGS